MKQQAILLVLLVSILGLVSGLEHPPGKPDKKNAARTHSVKKAWRPSKAANPKHDQDLSQEERERLRMKTMAAWSRMMNNHAGTRPRKIVRDQSGKPVRSQWSTWSVQHQSHPEIGGMRDPVRKNMKQFPSKANFKPPRSQSKSKTNGEVQKKASSENPIPEPGPPAPSSAAERAKSKTSLMSLIKKMRAKNAENAKNIVRKNKIKQAKANKVKKAKAAAKGSSVKKTKAKTKTSSFGSRLFKNRNRKNPGIRKHSSNDKRKNV